MPIMPMPYLRRYTYALAMAAEMRVMREGGTNPKREREPHDE